MEGGEDGSMLLVSAFMPPLASSRARLHLSYVRFSVRLSQPAKLVRHSCAHVPRPPSFSAASTTAIPSSSKSCLAPLAPACSLTRFSGCCSSASFERTLWNRFRISSTLLLGR